MEDFNKRFSKPPMSNKNIHRELLEHEILNDIFCWQEPRTLSNSLTVQYDKVVYLIKDSVKTRKLSRKRVMVHELMDGIIKIKYENEDLPYSVFDTLHRVNQGEVVSNIGHFNFNGCRKTHLAGQRTATTPHVFNLITGINSKRYLLCIVVSI